jgi:hypothetical protein
MLGHKFLPFRRDFTWVISIVINIVFTVSVIVINQLILCLPAMQCKGRVTSRNPGCDMGETLQQLGPLNQSAIYGVAFRRFQRKPVALVAAAIYAVFLLGGGA